MRPLDSYARNCLKTISLCVAFASSRIRSLTTVCAAFLAGVGTNAMTVLPCARVEANSESLPNVSLS